VTGKVLTACRRRCAFCWGLKGDASPKKGQSAHIDRDNANNDESNAAFLCLEHHDEYDVTPSQSRRLTVNELLRYRKLLFAHLKKSLLWTDTRVPRRSQKRSSVSMVSLDVYKARLPIYHTTVEFLRAVAKDLRPEMQVILKFARDTEQALFLFDESIADYLTLLFRKAIRLHAVNAMRDGGHRPPENFSELVKEETELALWFTDQYDVLRARFIPFLRLGNYSTSQQESRVRDLPSA
jgi:hypothetical protein